MPPILSETALFHDWQLTLCASFFAASVASDQTAWMCRLILSYIVWKWLKAAHDEVPSQVRMHEWAVWLVWHLQCCSSFTCDAVSFLDRRILHHLQKCSSQSASTFVQSNKQLPIHYGVYEKLLWFCSKHCSILCSGWSKLHCLHVK